jgi:aminoglycoside phosphotransferase (APT) family kinase protein
VPVPAVHELLMIDGRPGLVMDRIDGGPMLSAMLGRLWRLFPLVRRFGEIHAQINAVPAPGGVPTVHEWVRRLLERLEPADAGLRAWAEQELEALPGGDSLLHGDYHPLNLLMAGGDPQVIDWPTASAGPAEADIARTQVLVEAGDPPNGSPVMLTLLGVFRTRLFIPRYLRAYEQARAFDRELVERWRMVRAIERLAEAPASEVRALRRMIAASPLAPSRESETA